MADQNIWTFEDKPTLDFKNKRLFYKIDEICIDMTNWKELDSSVTKNGTFPYRIGFYDALNTKHYAHSARMKSGGIDVMLRDLHDRYKMVVLPTATVKVLAPKDQIDKMYGCAFCGLASDIARRGMGALPFTPTSENGVNARLESVLDSVMHQVCIGQVAKPYKRTQNSIFKNSVYRYEKEDALWAAQITKEPYEDDRLYGVNIMEGCHL